MWGNGGAPGVRKRSGAPDASGTGALPPPEHPFWRSPDAPQTVLATIDALAADAAGVEAELEAVQARFCLFLWAFSRRMRHALQFVTTRAGVWVRGAGAPLRGGAALRRAGACVAWACVGRLRRRVQRAGAR
jgi:hypothetical protein